MKLRAVGVVGRLQDVAMVTFGTGTEDADLVITAASRWRSGEFGDGILALLISPRVSRLSL